MKRKKKLKIKNLCIIGIIIIGIIAAIFFVVNFSAKQAEENYLEKVTKDNYGEITHYAIYGIHYNLKGSITIPEEFIVNNFELVLANKDKEIVIPIEKTNQDNYYNFSTGDIINDGLKLEKLELGKYYLLVKVSNDTETRYYSMKNETKYNNLEYYTLTKNNSNNRINIDWDLDKNSNLSTLVFSIEKTKLPDDVYDITLDPGHGGSDSGAVGYLDGIQYKESDLNLNVSLKLKKLLEDNGYKVAMTRTDDSYVEIYDPGGSATLANDTKSKFNFAIHHNSYEYQDSSLKGLEIYVANDSLFNLANSLIDSITKYAEISTSPKSVYRTTDGIYQRYFTISDINESAQEFRELGVEPYNRTTNMIWYYNIREVGGISTYANNDGRLKDTRYKYPKNEYYDSNNTAEPLLLELGYINNSSDLRNILAKPDNYAEGIYEGLINYLNK